MSFVHPIRILVLHDDPILGVGLSAALAKYADFEVLDSERPLDPQPPAWRAGSDRGAHVVIADYDHGVALAELAAARSHASRSPRIVVVSRSDREWEIRSALASGVHGYLLADCAIEELAAAVRAVHQGERHFSAQVARRLAESLAGEPLTAREEEVLRLLISGQCNKAIATRLLITVGTVKSHVRVIFGKLNVESRTQAIAAAQRRGLLKEAPQRSFEGAFQQAAGFAGRPHYAPLAGTRTTPVFETSARA